MRSADKIGKEKYREFLLRTCSKKKKKKIAVDRRASRGFYTKIFEVAVEFVPVLAPEVYARIYIPPGTRTSKDIWLFAG